MVIFKDRVSTYPGRVRLTNTATPGVFDMTRADQPIEPGTPINAALFNALQAGIDAAYYSAFAAAIYAARDSVTVFDNSTAVCTVIDGNNTVYGSTFYRLQNVGDYILFDLTLAVAEGIIVRLCAPTGLSGGSASGHAVIGASLIIDGVETSVGTMDTETAAPGGGVVLADTKFFPRISEGTTFQLKLMVTTNGTAVSHSMTTPSSATILTFPESFE